MSENLFSRIGPYSGLRLVLLFALALRVALLVGNIADHPWYFFQDPAVVEEEISSTHEPYMNAFGFEASNIAHALVCTNQGYASPFGGATGPSAWIAPGVVAPYALSFAIWGRFTFESIIFVFVIALLISLITTVVVFRIGSRIGGDPNAGLLAAFFFACLPFEAWIYAIASHVDLNLQVLWFAVLLLVVLRAMDSDRPPSGFEFGAVSSVAACFNPGFLLCTAAGYIFAIRGRSRREIHRFTLLMVLAHLLILGPVVVVQSLRLGAFVPVKSNAGFEIFLGNTREARGVLQESAFEVYHPNQNVEEFIRYGEIGEMRYVRAAERRFRENAGIRDILGISVRRAFHFFVGYHVKPWDSSPVMVAAKKWLWTIPVVSLFALVAIRRGRLESAVWAVLFFTMAYAVPYLLTGVMERYRIPIVTTVAVLLALVTRDVIQWWREHEGRRNGNRQALPGD